jgi:phosphatidylglycerophosphatase A
VSRFLDRLARFIGTAGYTGFFPVAPGTVGSLVGVGVFLLAGRWGTAWVAGALVVVTASGVWAAGRCAVIFAAEDPSPVVVDEVAGMLVTLVLAPRQWGWVLAGFILFRVFDILKPPPAGWIDRNVHGGFGIMTDDLVAGLYAWFVLQAALRLSW